MLAKLIAIIEVLLTIVIITIVTCSPFFLVLDLSETYKILLEDEHE